MGRSRYKVNNLKRKKGYRRGHLIALLVGFEDDCAVLWQIFRYVIKRKLTLELCGKRNDSKVLYNFHESVVDALRPLLKEGVRSIVVAAPMKTTYAADFLKHVQKHHSYLIQSKSLNRATFSEVVGSADRSYKVAELVKTKEFSKIITTTTSEESNHIVRTLDKHLYSINSDAVVLYSLKEIEDFIYDQGRHSVFRTQYLMLTDKYLSDSKSKNRIHRLLQISKNRKVKTRVFNAETPAGKRINQFGGIVFLALPTK